MFDEIRLSVSAKALKEATPTQLQALKENILADGKWETVKNGEVFIYMDWGTLMVNIDKQMLIGIEQSGYTHS